jgi:hypothetical protein
MQILTEILNPCRFMRDRRPIISSAMRTVALFALMLLLPLIACGQAYTIGPLLQSDDFHDLSNWKSELESGGTVAVKDRLLDLDVPAGATVWFLPRLTGPLMIQYTATVISAGGPNDRVSDLNCFWMATDSRSPGDIFGHTRSGKFTDYDQLLTYYVGLGGNSNTTTRFRRYIGKKDNRPLLPENDLRAKEDMIVANRPQRIRLIACGGDIEYWRDDTRLFQFHDDHPYLSGWFALRTTKNHMQVRDFRIFSLIPKP